MARCEEVKSNITDKESVKIAGPHRYIQGYNGIAITDAKSRIIMTAEAFGNETFPEMPDVLAETMGTLSGKADR
jgi:hypothetical protein